MNTSSFDPAHVPAAITTYQAAHDRRDVVTALAQFAAGASVVDDGHSYDGLAGVEAFLSTAASEYTYTRTLLAAEDTAPATGWRITNHLEGNFPGGEAGISPTSSTSPTASSGPTIAPVSNVTGWAASGRFRQVREAVRPSALRA